jgi:hypothetical protein
MNNPPLLLEVVRGLFRIVPVDPVGQVAWVYYLLQADVSLVPDSVQETWDSSNPSMIGAYLFVDQTIELDVAPQFVIAARKYFAPVIGSQPGSQLVAWLSSSPASPVEFPYQCISVQLGPFLSVGATRFKISQNQPVLFEWPQLGLEPTPSFGLQFQDTGVIFALVDGLIQLWADISQTQIQVSYGGKAQQNNQSVVPYPYSNPINPGDPAQYWCIEIPLSGTAAGAFCFGAGFSPGNLYQAFGCSFRFSYGQGESISYPIFPPAQQGAYGQLGMFVRFHPLFPGNTECSRLSLDLSGSGPGAQWSKNSLALRANYFQTPSGGSVTLQPCALPDNQSPDLPGSPLEYSPPGFGFSKGPLGDGSPCDWQFYLSPMGHFEIVSAPGPSVSPGTVDLMGGLFAEEYVRASLGDWVEFVPGKSAYSPGFQPGSGGSPPAGSPNEQSALTGAFTSSWMKYPSGSSQPGRAYFSQVSASVYYGRTGQQVCSMPVSSLYSHLEEVENAPILFPIAPYGGVYATWGSQPFPNQNVPAWVITAFEAQVLSSARHTSMPSNEYGPLFLPPRASTETILAARFRTAAVDVQPMPTTHTPQGILVRLNTDGNLANTWNALLLAVSPDVTSPAPFASLTISGSASNPRIVDSVLSNVLMKNQLFLVVSDPSHLGTFQNEISVGGFNFQLDVGKDPNTGEIGTLLIFKFNTSASLAQLAEQPNLWAGVSSFVSDVDDAQAVILDAIKVAKSNAGAQGNPFGYFNQIAHDPSWSGILALNCAINGNGMPLDFQMLLGGIKGQLRAHHFGIETNKVHSGSVDVGLSQSSLFGVIFYRNPTEWTSPRGSPPELDYEVETLTLVYSNSAITQFAVRVGLTINQLFGRETLLKSSPSSPPPLNTLVISGQYQKQGAIGVVTFSTDAPFEYEFPGKDGATRVIQEVRINQASLVPVSSTPGSPGTTVRASFNMAGEVFFAEDPFPNSDQLDLFSYGTKGESATGIAFSGLVADISFILNEEGEMEKESKAVTADLTALTFNPSSDSIRPGSLMGALPLQFSRFVYASSSSGISQSLTGTSPVHVLQLEGSTTESGSPAVSPQSPYGTTKPMFALEYDLPLGSLGSLSDGVGIMAKLLLAWGPSQVVPSNDGAAVLVQLPSLAAGLFGFTLQGILKTTFGDANLLKVDLDSGESVYAVLFNNIQLSVFGFSFPPGIVTDFTLFAGAPGSGAPRNTSNIGWFLATHQT